MKKAEFEQFKAERISVNRKAAGLKKSTQTKAVKYLKEVKGIDFDKERFRFGAPLIRENSIYGTGAIEIDVRDERGRVIQTHKVPRKVIFPDN